MSSLTEDDIYRTSTQYRLWAFTKDTLVSLRSTTNSLAIESVRAAIKSSQLKDGRETTTEKDVKCLTVEEEQRLVGFFCVRAMQLADFCDFPTNVKATAVQYMKRFYLSNSPMTYHPREIMTSALFLSTKTENHYISLTNFVSKLPKTTAEDVLAPEFLLTQGLRFTFDVRHPQRGLEGGYMELTALARGDLVLGNDIERTAEEIKQELLNLKPAQEGGKKPTTVEGVVARIQTAYGKAKETLKTSALLTDAYFLYTPSQLWLAAMLQHDTPLMHFYLDVKFPTASSTPLKSKLIKTLQSCGTLFNCSPSANPGKEEVAELTKIDKKLYECRNPEKIDLVGINRQQKREGEGEEGGVDEKVVKKRKMEREAGEREGRDVFGPAL